MKRALATTAVAGLCLLGAGATAVGASAAPLPDNCTKERGTVTCTTFEGPGKNQAGVGSTSMSETQGNTSNTSPEPQDLDSSCTGQAAPQPGGAEQLPLRQQVVETHGDEAPDSQEPGASA